jgi:hypothetical protein
MILIENDRGIYALVVDPYGEVRTNTNERTMLAAIKAGYHIDFAVSTWAGMQIIDFMVVTPNSQTELANFR